MVKCCWVTGTTGGVCVDFRGLVVPFFLFFKVESCFSTVILMCSWPLPSR